MSAPIDGDIDPDGITRVVADMETSEQGMRLGQIYLKSSIGEDLLGASKSGSELVGRQS